MNLRSEKLIDVANRYKGKESMQPNLEWFPNKSRLMLFSMMEPPSSSNDCKSSWRLNGVLYNNCTDLAEPGMCLCATQIDNIVSKELTRWRYCSKRECLG